MYTKQKIKLNVTDINEIYVFLYNEILSWNIVKIHYSSWEIGDFVNHDTPKLNPLTSFIVDTLRMMLPKSAE